MRGKEKSSISKAASIEEMVEFWDTHSLADYEDQTHEVEMTFDPAARRNYIGIDPDLLAELRQIAMQRKITTQTLVNLWLNQQVSVFKLQVSH